jgi:hypothetical protein
MNFIITGIVTLLSSIAAFFGRKLTVISASVAAFVVLTGALVVTIQALLSALLTVAVMPAWIVQGVGMFMPSNFALVLGSIVSAKAVRAAYDIAISKVHLINSAN